MNGSIVYMDASAVVKLCIDEPGSEALEARLRGCRLISSAVVEVEVTRAVRRVASDDVHGPVLATIGLLPLDRSMVRVAGTLLPRKLRTLDVIHVAAALQVAADLDAFVTYDRQLADAAASAGLPVESPR